MRTWNSLEFQGILSYTNYPQFKKGGILGKFWEFKIWDSLNALSSHKFQEILNTLNVKVLRRGLILEALNFGSVKGMLYKIYQEI